MTLGGLIEHCYGAVLLAAYRPDMAASLASYLINTVRLGRAGET